jgi:hypothetical protein
MNSGTQAKTHISKQWHGGRLMGKGKLSHPSKTLRIMLGRAKHFLEDAEKSGRPVKIHNPLKLEIIQYLTASMLVGAKRSI